MSSAMAAAQGKDNCFVSTLLNILNRIIKFDHYLIFIYPAEREAVKKKREEKEAKK